MSATPQPVVPLSPHGSEAPSAWVQRWSHLVRPGGTVLDVACGQGRHAWWFYKRNHPLALVDRAQAAMDSIAIPAKSCEKIVADIEAGPWPFAGRQFDAVVVTNYLWRPLMPTLLDSLAPGGVLIYETFAQGNETVGKPSRPDFLLRTGELLAACNGLRVVAYEDGFEEAPPRFTQRIAALREPAASAAVPRYWLTPRTE
ncbi:MAG: class I SAM-dependent methyltransferase [Polaromonas sp.]|uniref:class I SAM-dependent methyltransferase n=1 Tax=Polaromonas sp. TaxID=1869339 RepID=UPI0027372B41|nr:class I SAM-dependent methyltransferase [Polaromonas sp.]MDP1954278.1 class I SAM-dependent methyltransferase [Polaromonas sp.]MDP3249063.1 class I SAM-dependent methyltransferase [Polaromonas sp.]MDP3750383.1 class I SAM-dependent methyltransferase [Polaromonas sp.]